MSGTLTPAPALTVRQAAGRLVAEQVRELQRHERGARAGGNPVAVHQMRVTTRRLRAGLRVFRRYLVPGRRVRRGLSGIARRLGRVRDHDVLLALLEERHLGALAGTEAARLETLIAWLKERRFRAQQKLEASLARRRYRKLRVALREFAARPRFGGEENVPAERVLSEAIERRGGKIARHAAMTDPAPSPAALHRLRIEVKRLRYVLDFHAASCGVAYAPERKLARQLQECLGEIHDHDVLLGWVDEGKGFFAGPWPALSQRLAKDRHKLYRRFVRLRKRWRDRTTAAPAVAPAEASRFASLEAAPVTLRLITTPKHVASAMAG